VARGGYGSSGSGRGGRLDGRSAAAIDRHSRNERCRPLIPLLLLLLLQQLLLLLLLLLLMLLLMLLLLLQTCHRGCPLLPFDAKEPRSLRGGGKRAAGGGSCENR
jgi:hypothetical protein